jgi:hypothetical protein
MMMYYRNRLVMSYLKAGIQLEQNQLGIGVIGFLNANHLTPSHNKQDFNKDWAYDVTL